MTKNLTVSPALLLALNLLQKLGEIDLQKELGKAESLAVKDIMEIAKVSAEDAKQIYDILYASAHRKVKITGAKK